MWHLSFFCLCPDIWIHLMLKVWCLCGVCDKFWDHSLIQMWSNQNLEKKSASDSRLVKSITPNLNKWRYSLPLLYLSSQPQLSYTYALAWKLYVAVGVGLLLLDLGWCLGWMVYEICQTVDDSFEPHPVQSPDPSLWSQQCWQCKTRKCYTSLYILLVIQWSF